MTRNSLQTLIVVSIVLLAGCTGGLSGSVGSPTTDASQTEPSTAASTDAGTVAFYVSDEENAIGDFQSLGVTVTHVGFERAAADGGSWVEREVDNVTVDLTKLQGSNATLVDEYAIPNGTYTKVFLHVGAVNATLTNGEQVRVKLPSEKLQLEKTFTVDDGSKVNFVFDITVHSAGNSGKYVLTPVIAESGTDVPIEPVDEEDQDEDMHIQLVGNVSQDGNATVAVTRDGEPVENATVFVDEDEVGTTDVDGRLTFGVPDEEEVNVVVEKSDERADLDVEFEDEREDEEPDREDEAHDGEDGTRQDDGHADTLTATFVGDVSQGKNATLNVTWNGSGVANATVVVNDEFVGSTDADGELTFEVPDTETVTVTVQAGDEEAELEREFESDDASWRVPVLTATPVVFRAPEQADNHIGGDRP